MDVPLVLKDIRNRKGLMGYERKSSTFCHLTDVVGLSAFIQLCFWRADVDCRYYMDYDLYDDEQLVNGILNNNRPLIEYFFQKKCSKLFAYILLNVFDGNIDKRELVSELYLFMANNNWAVIRKFQYRSSLMTYVSVVAVRFFQKKTHCTDRFHDYRGTKR